MSDLNGLKGYLDIVSTQVRWGSVTITGNYRENNEDRCLVDPQGRFFLVADGMGGQSAGEKASEMAVELIPQKLEQLVDFQKGEHDNVCKGIDVAVEHANNEIMALSAIDPQYNNMGTTIAMLIRSGETFFVAGIGDSRVYLLRGGQIQRLTRDHSISEALLEAGAITKEEAARHRYRNMLYRYLGSKEGATGANAKPLPVQSGDRYMLCSDGVLDGNPDENIAKLLSENNDPQQAAAAIVEAAQQGGSRDNITCVVVFVD